MTRRADIRATYDRIASHFAVTRPQPWPEVERFLEGREAEIGLDLGCGNGRHAELLAGRTQKTFAADLSRAALETARTRADERRYLIEPIQLDAASLPLRKSTIDLVVYVATIHHLPNRDLRIASLDELARILTSDGVAIISAWSVSHNRFDAEVGFDTTIDWTLPDGEVVPRFYHIYDLEEFRADLNASQLAINSTYEASGNCYAQVGSART